MDKRLKALGFRGRQDVAVACFQDTYRRGRWRLKRLKVDGVLGPRTSRALDHCIEHDGYVSTHFRYAEFRCKCYGRYANCRGVLIQRRLVIVLNRLRRLYYPKGITIVSGYRCVDHNRAVGGAAASQHLYGTAADVPAVVPRSAFLPARIHGVGYNRSTGKIAHVDVRSGDRVFWEYGR